MPAHSEKPMSGLAYSSNRRFTISGDDELERLIERQLMEITEDLTDNLPRGQIVALVLGGGYGRGEGGALQTARGLAPYNDYDLVLIHRCHDAKRLKQLLQRIHREHSVSCGIHVDITPLKASDLPTLPHTLTWLELQQGHQTLLGDEQALSQLGERRLSQIPESEWGRLLFNRGSGLLFSCWMYQGKECHIQGGEARPPFVTRQIEKAWLALGDVWLADRTKYAPSVQERAKSWRAEGVAVPRWSEHYLSAVNFKLNPVLERPERELIAELAELARLYSSELAGRTTAEFRPAAGLYATVRQLGAVHWPLSQPWRYPRERMRKALVAELQGNILPRLRLVGSPRDYVRLWEQYA